MTPEEAAAEAFKKWEAQMMALPGGKHISVPDIIGDAATATTFRQALILLGMAPADALTLTVAYVQGVSMRKLKVELPPDDKEDWQR